MIADKKCIYILCPEKKITGGTEALHQLRYYLEMLGHTAFIVYYNNDGDYIDAEPPERYRQYFGKEIRWINGNSIIDTKENCVVAPEFSSHLLNNIKYAKCVVWWLSVKYYDGGKFMKKLAVRHWLKQSLYNPKRIMCFRKYFNPVNLNIVIHLCASEYAYQYVTRVLHQPAFRMIEPISKDFLNIGPEKQLNRNRKNIIAYNPAKPSRVMKKLLKQGRFEFVAIQGMNPSQISELLRSVKLYIDFGEFPGPERIPKEAVYNGAEIIVGRRNAACNNFDINIPEKYKIRKYTNLEIVSDTIEKILTEYENNYHDFDEFRNQIAALEANFLQAIQAIWG